MIRTPFVDHLFRKINSSFIFPAIVTDAADKLFNLGCLQYQEFVKKRFILGSDDIIKSPIHKNKLKLPRDDNATRAESPRIKITSAAITKLRDACIFRKELAMECFKMSLLKFQNA